MEDNQQVEPDEMIVGAEATYRSPAKTTKLNPEDLQNLVGK